MGRGGGYPRHGGASAFEIISLRLPDSAAAKQLEPVLGDYLTTREGAFTGYAPAEAELASNGRVRREGRTLGLFICPNPEGAGDAFTAAYNGEALPSPPDSVSAPIPESTPDPEPLVIPLHDILHRLLLEAACPEWRTVEKVWSRSDDGRRAIGRWASEAGDGVLSCVLPDDPLLMGVSYQVSVHLRSSEEEAAAFAEALNQQLEEYREFGDEELIALLEKGCAVSSGCYAALIISEHTEDAVLLFPRIVNNPETIGYFDRLYSGGLYPVPRASAGPETFLMEVFPIQRPALHPTKKDGQPILPVLFIGLSYSSTSSAGAGVGASRARIDREIFCFSSSTAVILASTFWPSDRTSPGFSMR